MHIRELRVSHSSTKYTLSFHIFGTTAALPSDVDLDYGEFSTEANKSATPAECLAAIQAAYDALYPELRADWVLRNALAALLQAVEGP